MGVSIEFVENPDWTAANGHSVLKARGVLTDDFILMMSDHVLDWKILAGLVREPLKPGEVVLAVDRRIGEVFDLPSGCIPLAGSEIAPFQAFRFGSSAYGLLFHLEMEAQGIEALCRECGADLSKAELTAQQVTSRALPRLPQLHHIADRLVAHLVSSRR